jgi:acetyl esterase/lipase
MIFKKASLLVVIAALFTAGCTYIGVSVANFPTYFSGLERKADIEYGREESQKLDIYQSAVGSDKKPVVIFIHGGRWSFGDKGQYRFVAARLAEAGYITVIPDYKKYPQVKFPEIMDDPAQATAWVIQNVEEYNGNPARIYLMGHSAGAHMAALIISDERYLKKYGASGSDIAAFAGLAGPYDFTPEDTDLKDLFGPPDKYPQMQAPTFITGREPPMLLLQGEDDDSVKMFNLTRLADAIKKHGGRVITKTYPDLGHIGIIASFARADSMEIPIVKDCLDFFAKYNSNANINK